MRLIADGVVERDGVEGLAARVGYTTRHLHRLLAAELGAGPLALARARRAQNARILIETTPMPFADVAFAAGFASVRQFNDTVREVYADARRPSCGPVRAGRSRRPGRHSSCGCRCGRRTPAARCCAFLAAHLVPGVEQQRAGLVRAHAAPCRTAPAASG